MHIRVLDSPITTVLKEPDIEFSDFRQSTLAAVRESRYVAAIEYLEVRFTVNVLVTLNVITLTVLC
ncbi:hypothetical protein DPMN_074545 [Dreissena polymorpha]|uniref:Uncharacterized protein n=1 Tax=Dreissena polymorpha TaxID=45954 RepID=A0A9D4BNH8_DREPO|nr:hypothetical protein DPMN_074545 [Dreissena polymorpha]